MEDMYYKCKECRDYECNDCPFYQESLDYKREKEEENK